MKSTPMHMTQEQFKELITWTYQLDSKPERDKRIAIARKKTGLKNYQIYQKAVELGVKKPIKPVPRWTEQEIKLLEINSHKHPKTIAEILKKQGFVRSECSISCKRNEILGGYLQLRRDKGIYSTVDITKMLGVSDNTVVGWIKKGWLNAKQQKTERGEFQNDPWLVNYKDLREFIIDNVSVIPFDKVDKYWLVDLLTNYKADR